ncbi:MAG: hypothetical protein R6V21_07485 [Pelovirga sp.]
MQNVYCPQCETERPMEIVEEGVQDSRQQRIFVQRVRRCLICERYYVTAEVKSCLVYEYDQSKNMIDQICREIFPARLCSADIEELSSKGVR